MSHDEEKKPPLTKAEREAKAAQEEAERIARNHKKMARYHIKRTLPMLSRYGRPHTPARPSALPERDDYDLAGKVKLAREGFPQKADRAILESFSSWSSLVMRSEAQSAGNFVFLLRVADHLRQAGFLEESYRVVQFVNKEWRCNLELPPEGDLERQQLAERYSRRNDVFPDMLLFAGHRPLPRRGDSDDGPQQIDFETALDEVGNG